MTIAHHVIHSWKEGKSRARESEHEMTASNEYILAEAVELAAMANRASRGDAYSPDMLSVCNEVREENGELSVVWTASIGEYNTYPRVYISVEGALAGLRLVIEAESTPE